MALLDELPKMLFEGVAAGTSQLDDLSDANAPMFANLIQDLHGKIRQTVADPVYAFGSRQSRSGKNQRRSLRNEPKFSAVSEAALRATLEFRGCRVHRRER
jgi:hypothetical protein